MMPIVSRAQVHVGNVRVDLRRRDIAMAQQRLHRTRISAMLQEVRGEAMSQRVRRAIFDARLFRVSLDHGPRKLSRERPSSIQKNVRRRPVPITRFHRRVLLQPVNRALAQRHAPFLVSLAADYEVTISFFIVNQVQHHDFRSTKPQTIQQ